MVLGAAVVTPQAVGVTARQRFHAMGGPIRARGGSRQYGLAESKAAYFLVLLACGIGLGLFGGGFVGFMESATPRADLPYSFAQLATSDVQGAVKMRQHWSVSHRPHEYAARSMHESSWQHRFSGAAQGHVLQSARVVHGRSETQGVQPQRGGPEVRAKRQERTDSRSPLGAGEPDAAGRKPLAAHKAVVQR